MTTNIDLPGGLGTLKPTLGAAKSINTAFGNFMEAMRRISNLDFDAFVTIIAFGLDQKRRDVEDDIYAVGLPDLVQPLSDFVTLLANGGRPIAPGKKDTNTGKPKPLGIFRVAVKNWHGLARLD